MTISRITGSARASTATPDSPASGANVNGSASQAAYSSGKRVSTSWRVSPSQRPWLISRRPSRSIGCEAVRPPDDRGGLERARERAGVDGGDRFVREPLGEARRLPAPLVGQIDADRAGEAVLGGQLRGAVADQEQAGGVRHGRGNSVSLER